MPLSAGYVSAPTDAVAWAGLVRTNDKGRTWHLVAPACQEIEFLMDDPSEFDETVFVSEGRGWLRVVGSTWQTEDGGASWTRLPGGEMTSFGFGRSAGWMRRENASGGRTFVTADMGAHWSACRTSATGWRPFGRGQWFSPSLAFSVVMQEAPGHETYAIGISEDGGCTWAPKWQPEPQERLGEVFFSDLAHGWATAYGGLLFRTFDGGNTWRQSANPGSSVFGKIYFSTPTTGFMHAGPLDPKQGLTGIVVTRDGNTWADLDVAELSSLPPQWQYGRFVNMVLSNTPNSAGNDKRSGRLRINQRNSPKWTSSGTLGVSSNWMVVAGPRSAGSFQERSTQTSFLAGVNSSACTGGSVGSRSCSRC